MELLQIEHENWREAGACNDMADVDFFPSAEDVAAIRRAQAVCDSCPVMDECLTYALETNQSEGIWGGMTATERAKLRRRWLRELREAS